MQYLKDKGRLAAPAAVAAAAVLAFFNSLANGFVWDDLYTIVNNPLTGGWDQVPGIFSSGYWHALGKTGGLYRPLTIFSFMAERSLAGTSPFLYHLDNILIHAACSVLVYLILKEVLPDGMGALPGALLFAAHPVHSEAVAWVSGRAEVLAAFFFLAGLLAFTRRPARPPWYINAPALYLLGMLSKEGAAVLPAAILVYMLVIRRERRPLEIIRRLAPFAVALAVYLPVRYAVLGGTPTPPDSVFQGMTGLPAALVTAKAFFHYIRLSLFPTDLRFLYLFPPPGKYSVEVVVPLAALALAFFFSFRERTGVYGFFMLFFFVALVPVSNIIPTEVLMTERALYLPVLGSCALTGAALARAGEVFRGRYAREATAAILLLFAALSWDRNAVWKDEASFDRERIRVHTGIAALFPEHARNRMLLAETLIRNGRAGEAAGHLEKALALEPENAECRKLLAAVYRGQGRLEDALAQLERLLETEPPDRVHADMAILLSEIGRKREAEEMARLAIRENPRGALQRLNLGLLLAERGKKDEALSSFMTAAAIDPSLFQAHLEAGVLLGGKEDFAGAYAMLKKAAALMPDNAEARLYLGAACASLGRVEEARAELTEALRLRPGYPEAEGLLAGL